MSIQTSPSSPEFVTIVVPVRNEEVLLPRALAALAVAIDALTVLPQPDRPAVSVLLVLDQCTDLSARVAALWPDFDRVEIEAAGEFAPVDCDEDRLLVAALRELGVAEARTALIPVLTSGRRVGRAPAGFAEYLREHMNPDWADTEAAH